MAISIKSRDVVNFNAVGPKGGPKKDQYLDFVDDAGTTQASLYVPGSGATPTFSVDDTPVGGVQTVYSETVTLTDAQIKALPTTPVEVVPAPGAGKVNILVRSFAVTSFAGGPYGNLDSPSYLILTLADAETISNGAQIDGSSFDDPTGDAWFLSFTPRVYGGNPILELTDTIVGLDNEPIRMKATSNSGVFTGGDAANTLKITTLYTVLDL